MRVTVKFFTVLRESTGKKEEEIESPNIITVEELLNLLSKRHGRGFTYYVHDEKGRVERPPTLSHRRQEHNNPTGIRNKVGGRRHIRHHTTCGRRLNREDLGINS